MTESYSIGAFITPILQNLPFLTIFIIGFVLTLQKKDLLGNKATLLLFAFGLLMLTVFGNVLFMIIFINPSLFNLNHLGTQLITSGLSLIMAVARIIGWILILVTLFSKLRPPQADMTYEETE